MTWKTLFVGGAAWKKALMEPWWTVRFSFKFVLKFLVKHNLENLTWHQKSFVVVLTHCTFILLFKKGNCIDQLLCFSTLFLVKGQGKCWTVCPLTPERDWCPVSLYIHYWIKHWSYESAGNNHPLKKLSIVQKILLFITVWNV